jgi:hypothetical protein
MPPRKADIPDSQRCRFQYSPLRRCGVYARFLNGVILNGYCHNHQWFAKREALVAQAARAASGQEQASAEGVQDG